MKDAAGDCAATASDWLRRTQNNTSPRRLVVLQSWAYIGLGHSILGSAQWMQLVLQSAPDRAVRFAHCAPSALLRAHYGRPRGGSVPPLTACEQRAHFDLANSIAYVGLRTLAAAASDLVASGSGISHLKRPSCARMLQELQGPSERVIISYPSAKELLACLARARAPHRPQLHQHRARFAAIRCMWPVADVATPVCDVGLQ